MSESSDAVSRWQLQNQTISEMSDDVRRKVSEQMLEGGWVVRVVKYAVADSKVPVFDPEYFTWAARVGKMVVGDEVAPYCVNGNGVAIWRLPPAEIDDSAAAQTVVE